MASTKTTTAADETLLLRKNSFYSVPIDLGSSRKGSVLVRGDVADYFNIAVTDAATTGGLTLVTKTTTGKVQKFGAGLGDTTPTDVAIPITIRYYAPPRKQAKGGGRAIRIATEMKLKSGYRTVGIRFPASATNAAVSVWLKEQCKAHAPTTFVTEHGTRYYVVAKGSISDINPGNDKAPADPQTP